MAPTTGIDTAAIKEKALADLLAILEGACSGPVRGKKTVVLDQSLSGPIGLFAKFSLLQDYGVDKIHWLHDPPSESIQKNIIYIARCTPQNAQLISAQVKNYSKIPGQEFDCSAFFVPRRTLVCEKVLEDEGVVGDISIGEYPLYFIPLEPDLLSLELESSFQELYLHRDYTSVFYAAKALMNIQQTYGLFPRIIGKGDGAKRLVDALTRMRGEVTVDDALNPFALTPSSTIESLIIIDRGIDFVTPLLTQLTYEGLIDEIYGIKNSKVDLDISIVGNPQGTPNPASSSATSAPAAPATATGSKRTVVLDSTDKLFEDLRDTNFAIVGNLLNKVSKRLKADYEGRHQAKTVTEIKQFVNKLGGLQAEHQSLRIHTGLTEEIVTHTRSDLFNKSLEVQQNLAAGSDPSTHHETIEELIYRGAELEQVLRLLCIESCVGTGFRPKDYEFFKKEILQAYGYHHILTFDALEKLELLQASATIQNTPNTRTSYGSLRKLLRLIVDEVNEQDPEDISYVYSGYAPLSARLVQCIIQKQYMQRIIKGGKGAVGGPDLSTVVAANTGILGWKGFEEALRQVKGKTIDEIQRGEDKAVRARMILNGQNEKRMTLVFFLGGCTFTEIAALRFIGKQQEGNRKILIGTTSIINGNKMIQAAISSA
ncbi:Sec1-like protein [Peziza echinospora]|nr:Sec1-like protein [Peziza echinospora]